MSWMFQFFLLIFALISFSSCGKLKSANLAVENIHERISPTYNGPPELPYCSGTIDFTGPDVITVAGKAEYEYRELVYHATFRGLGDVPQDEDGNNIPSPIRHAEIVILDSQNNVVQCGETDADGDYNLTLPLDGALYRVRVHSRGFNDNHVRASILRSPESNQIYHVEKVITANTNKTVNLLAKATGTLEGGAFHIYDQILAYNIKLRELVGTCDTGSHTGCVPFTVAPKVLIFWEKGFNPGTYLPGSPGSSFYYKGTNRVFLLGGLDGDVDYSDTDHFDRSIIAHEYFHFLEATMGRTSSPGGGHNGNQILDPRLAWSEGAAQYFQGVMTGISRVMDSRGNISGASALIVDYSLENVDTDQPQQENEGEFREFSVARLLWDTYDDTSGETNSPVLCSAANIDNVQDKCAKDGFEIFWSILTGNNGFKDSNFAFVSASLLHHKQNKYVGATPTPEVNWRPLRNYEFHAHDRYPSMAGGGNPAERVPFGTRLQDCPSGAHWFTMGPPFISTVNTNWRTSHLVTNNNFLHFVHPGGQIRIDVIMDITGGMSVEANLIIYRDDFYLYDNADIIGHDTVPQGDASTPTYSIFTTNNYPAGNYMINVNVINTSGANGVINYNVRHHGAYQCPRD